MRIFAPKARRPIRSFLFAIANLFIASYMVPAGTKHYFTNPPLTDGENLLIAIMTFVALTLLEMLFTITSMEAKERHERELLIAESSFDTALLSIREALRSANIGANSAFAKYFQRQLDTLEIEVRSVAATSTLAVTEQHLFLSDSVLAAFDGSRDSELCLVHRLSHNDQILSSHELEWIRKVHTLVGSKRIKKVKRLFLYAAQSELNQEASKQLIAMHLTEKAYDCRVVAIDEFDRLKRDFGIGDEIVDFGIYSNKYLYRSSRYTPEGGLRGVYSGNKSDIERFQQWFDACWGCPRASQPASDQRLTMAQLLMQAGSGITDSALLAAGRDNALASTNSPESVQVIATLSEEHT